MLVRRPVPAITALSVATGLASRSPAALHGDPRLVRGLAERSVVGVVLVGVGNGESFDGAVEGVVGAEVAGDLRRVAGARVRGGQRRAADLAVEREP